MCVHQMSQSISANVESAVLGPSHPTTAPACVLEGSHVPYSVPSPQTNPLRDRPVLLLCLGELLLGAEGFVGLGVRGRQYVCCHLVDGMI